jgi:uncharacterized MAPEG superfamily protein
VAYATAQTKGKSVHNDSKLDARFIRLETYATRSGISKETSKPIKVTEPKAPRGQVFQETRSRNSEGKFVASDLGETVGGEKKEGFMNIIKGFFRIFKILYIASYISDIARYILNAWEETYKKTGGDIKIKKASIWVTWLQFIYRAVTKTAYFVTNLGIITFILWLAIRIYNSIANAANWALSVPSRSLFFLSNKFQNELSFRSNEWITTWSYEWSQFINKYAVETRDHLWLKLLFVTSTIVLISNFWKKIFKRLLGMLIYIFGPATRRDLNGIGEEWTRRGDALHEEVKGLTDMVQAVENSLQVIKRNNGSSEETIVFSSEVTSGLENIKDGFTEIQFSTRRFGRKLDLIVENSATMKSDIYYYLRKISGEAEERWNIEQSPPFDRNIEKLSDVINKIGVKSLIYGDPLSDHNQSRYQRIFTRYELLMRNKPQSDSDKGKGESDDGASTSHGRNEKE